jgi:uncharacterized repeat protein (TIGR01451 family)
MMSRGALGLASPRTRRGLALTWAVLFTLSLLLQYATFAFAPAALAVHETHLFELDGNATNDPAVLGDDWNSHPGATGNRFTFINDLFNSPNDVGFTGGGSKDGLNTSSWDWEKATVTPDKDDIEHAYAASYVQDGHTFVYFGLDKLAVNGDSNVGFWFFKNGIHLTGGPDTGGFAPVHSVGDLLVLSQFTNGGDISVIDLYEWVGSGGSDGAVNRIATGNGCTGSPAVDRACAVANTEPEAAPWSYHPKSGPDDIFPTASFFEGGIDLDRLFDGHAPCFSGFLADTRTSQAVDAVLKDVAVGNFNTCVPPTITTDASVSTFHFGDAGVTDQADLSGTDGPASGTVKFFVCTPAELPCDSGGTQIGSAIAVTTSTNGGSATSSPAYTPAAAGTYCFRAEYTPDAASQYLAAKHTDSSRECFTVVKNPTTISTSEAEAVDIGESISDSAVLDGSTSDSTGTITFNLYGPGAGCSGNPVFTATEAVDGDGTYGPVTFTPTTAGVYHWIASYDGDAHNLGSTGACLESGENDTVNKVTPTIATQASAAVTVGATITDTATVSGGNSPTGTVSFALYGPADPDCLAAAVFTSADRPLSGGTATSEAFTTDAVGTYHWIATYNGDANNNSVSGACGDANESVVVNPATPSISTSLVAGAKTGAAIGVTIGTSVHDTSTLSGATADAGGTVHYQVFSDSNCQTVEADAGTIDVVDGVPGNSLSIVFSHAGTFYWQADYSGDAKNTSASSACNLETVTVAANAPSISTTLSSGDQTGAEITVLFGSSVSDQATLTDASAEAGGTVTYTVYSDASCSTVGADAGTKTVTNGIIPASDAISFPTAGTYYWQAAYSGDADNAPATSVCTDEVLTVTTPDLDVTKLVATNDGAFGPTSNAMPGDTLNYQITIGNSGNADATDVPVSDDISALLAHATYNDDCSNGCDFAGDTLTWTIPTIAAGDSVTLTFSVTLDDTFPTGTTDLPNVVVVTGPGSNCAEGSDGADCGTDTTVSTSTLVIAKTVEGNTGGTDPDLDVPAANIGDTLTYSLAYDGHGSLTNAVITDVLPEGLAYVDGTAAGNADFNDGTYDTATRTITWEAKGALPDPAAGTVTYDVTVLDTAPDFAQPLVNLATIDSDETGPDTDTASVAVLAPPEQATATPPATSTIQPESAPSNPGFALMLILLGVAGLAIGIGFLTPTPERVRRRDRLG